MGEFCGKKEKRKREILSAAEALFDSHGYNGSSMLMIAGEAGISVGTLYNYFGSKNDILMRIASDRVMRYLREALDAVPGKGSVVDRVCVYVNHVIREMSEHNGVLFLDAVSFTLSDMEGSKDVWGMTKEILKHNSLLLSRVVPCGDPGRSIYREASVLLMYIMRIGVARSLYCDDITEVDFSLREMIKLLLSGLSHFDERL